MHEYFVPELPARDVFSKWNVPNFVVGLSQVKHIDGNFFRAVINVDVNDVEYLVVVVGPYLDDAILLETSFLVH